MTGWRSPPDHSSSARARPTSRSTLRPAVGGEAVTRPLGHMWLLAAAQQTENAIRMGENTRQRRQEKTTSARSATACKPLPHARGRWRWGRDEHARASGQTGRGDQACEVDGGRGTHGTPAGSRIRVSWRQCPVPSLPPLFRCVARPRTLPSTIFCRDHTGSMCDEMRHPGGIDSQVVTSASVSRHPLTETTHFKSRPVVQALSSKVCSIRPNTHL